MTREQLQRRTVLADRHDQALNRCPDRNGEAFRAELTLVVEGLAALADEVGAAEPFEYGRTLRYLGDAYFDLARGTNVTILARAAAAYAGAEQFVGPDQNPVERAKLDFSYGNTLRGLSEGTDVSLLKQVRDRYASALSVFRVHMPQGVTIVEQARRSL